MKKLLATTALTFWAFAGPASALEFTVSDFAGTGNFGTITAHFTDVTDTIVEVDINMAPNFIIDTGSHYALTMSLEGTGRISQASLDALNGGVGVNPFTALSHDVPADYKNAPFQNFTDAVAGNCGSGASSGGCGATLDFLITGFQGFDAATTQYNGQNIFAAVDIFDQANGKTGVVGLVTQPVPTPFSVPGPIVGAGLPGLISACFGLLGLSRLRRRRTHMELPAA